MTKLWRIVGRGSKGSCITSWAYGDTLEDAKKKVNAELGRALADFVSIDDELCCEVDPFVSFDDLDDMPGEGERWRRP